MFIGILDHVGMLEPKKAILGEPICKHSIGEPISKAYTRRAYAIAERILTESRALEDGELKDEDIITTVKNVYKAISENPNITDVTNAQKDFIRCTLKADHIVIICDNKHNKDVARVQAIWESNCNPIIEILECNRFEDTTPINTDGESEDLMFWRLHASIWAPAYGYTFENPPIRHETVENDITMYSKRPDFKRCFAKDPNHTTKVFSTSKAYLQKHRAIASKEDIERYKAFILATIDFCETYNVPREDLFDLDYRLCDCGLPFKKTQNKDAEQRQTFYNICPTCGRRYPLTTPIDAEIPTYILDSTFYGF